MLQIDPFHRRLQNGTRGIRPCKRRPHTVIHLIHHLTPGIAKAQEELCIRETDRCTDESRLRKQPRLGRTEMTDDEMLPCSNARTRWESENDRLDAAAIHRCKGPSRERIASIRARLPRGALRRRAKWGARNLHPLVARAEI